MTVIDALPSSVVPTNVLPTNIFPAAAAPTGVIPADPLPADSPPADSPPVGSLTGGSLTGGSQPADSPPHEAVTVGSGPLPVGRTILPGGASVVEDRRTVTSATITIRGEIDGFDAAALIDTLTGCLLEGVSHLDVDLDEVPFADVAILRVLHRVERFARRAGGIVRVTNCGPGVARLHAWVAATTNDVH